MDAPSNADLTARPGRRCKRSMGSLRAAALLALVTPAGANELAELGLEQLMQLRVVGASRYEQRQADAPAAVSVITREEIRAFGWRTLDQALASLPGVHLNYDRQYSHLGTRGFALLGDFNTRVLLTVDGSRLNDPLYDGAAVGHELPLDLDLVERIEFIPGPGGAVYGQNAMFGVVNLVTRSGAEVGGVELAAAHQHPQSLREGRASWGGRLENGADLLLSVSGVRARGEDLRLDFGATGISGVAGGLDGERAGQFMARGALGAWQALLLHGERRKDDPTGAFLSDPLTPGQYQRDELTLAHLRLKDAPLGDQLRISGSVIAGEQRYRSGFVYGTPVLSLGSSSWRGTEWQLVSTAIPDHTLLMGFEFQDNRRIDQSGYDPTQAGPGVRIASPGHRTGVYAQDEWRLGPALATTLGLRLDRNSREGAEISPRAAVIWQFDAATTFKALYGGAHRAPNAYESQLDDGVSIRANPALKGERIRTLELVADHRLSTHLAVRASAYHWDLRDLVTLGTEPVSGLPQYRSGQPLRATGLELSLDRTWDVGARLRGSLSTQDVQTSDVGRPPSSPRVLARLALSAPLPMAGWRAAYEFRFDDRQRMLGGSEVGSFALSDLRLSSTGLAPGLELAISVRNLFDKRYSLPVSDTNWQPALEQDGRSLRVALLYAF
jgi:outer membrane receptor protein involved in Fe transport